GRVYIRHCPCPYDFGSHPHAGLALLLPRICSAVPCVSLSSLLTVTLFQLRHSSSPAITTGLLAQPLSSAGSASALMSFRSLLLILLALCFRSFDDGLAALAVRLDAYDACPGHERCNHDVPGLKPPQK